MGLRYTVIILLESTYSCMVNRNGPVAPWFVKILRMQRSEVHIDSTFLHRCRVGALIYDSEAG